MSISGALTATGIVFFFVTVILGIAAAFILDDYNDRKIPTWGTALIIATPIFSAALTVSFWLAGIWSGVRS